MRTRPGRWTLVVAALALALTGHALRAQAAGSARGDSAAAADSAAAYGPERPPAPRQFRLAATGSALLWPGTASRTPKNAAALGLDVERLLLPYLSVRLGVAYTPERVVQGMDSTDVHGYIVEVVAEPRLALAPLVAAGVVPFGEVGLGSMVFDPSKTGLPTRSQNAFVLGGGVDVRLATRVGGRVEWRHYSVQIQSLFDATDYASVSRGADRIMASLYWTF